MAPVHSTYNIHKNISNGLDFILSLRQERSRENEKKIVQREDLELNKNELKIHNNKIILPRILSKNNSIDHIRNRNIEYEKVNNLITNNFPSDSKREEKNNFNSKETHNKRTRKFFNSLEMSIRVSHKNSFHENREDNIKRDKDLYYMCDNQKTKIMNILNDLIQNKEKLPKLMSPSQKAKVNYHVNLKGNNKNFSERYDPLVFYYPIRKISRRNEYGVPFLY